MSPPEARSSPLPAWAIPTLVAVLAAIELLIFWPGVVTPDSVIQYSEALTGHYEDWHPPIMAFLWRQLGWIAPGQAPLLVLEALLYWSGVALLADALGRGGRWRSAIAVVAIAALPIPFGQMGTVIKDSLLAACCLAAAGLALHDSRGARAAAALLLIIAAATRFNAMFAAAPLLVWLAPAGWSSKRLPHAVLLIAAVVTLGTTGWLIDKVALAPRATHPMTSLIGFDLAGIVEHGGKAAIPPYSRPASRIVAAHCYTPAEFNPRSLDECDDVEGGMLSAIDGRLTRYWLAAIVRHPIPWLRHRLAHLNLNWRFLVPRIPADAIFIMNAPANELGLSYHPSPTAKAVYVAASVIADSPLGRPASWLAIAAAVLILSPAFRFRRAVIALSLSALLYGGAYGVVSVAPDLRYNLWTMLAAAMALAIAAADFRLVPRSHLRRAAAAIAAIMLLETIWLVFALPSPV